MEFVDLISQFGFPVVMCLLLFSYLQKKDEQHKTEIDKMSDAINNNTTVMMRLLDKLSDE